MRIANLIETKKEEFFTKREIKLSNGNRECFNQLENEVCDFFIEILNKYKIYNFNLCLENGRLYEVFCESWRTSEYLEIHLPDCSIFPGKTFCCDYCRNKFKDLAKLFVIDP